MQCQFCPARPKNLHLCSYKVGGGGLLVRMTPELLSNLFPALSSLKLFLFPSSLNYFDIVPLFPKTPRGGGGVASLIFQCLGDIDGTDQKMGCLLAGVCFPCFSFE